jgi:alanine-synthesizing transaminase
MHCAKLPWIDIGNTLLSRRPSDKAELGLSPGNGFGELGERFVRIASVENDQQILQAVRNLKRFLDNGEKTLHNVIPIGAFC